MLQNREVAGATLGRGPRPPAPPTFGAWGWVCLAVPVALIAALALGAALDPDDPLGLRWSWIGIAVMIALGVFGRIAGSRGAADDAAWRAAPRTLARTTQRITPFVLGALVVCAAVAFVAGLLLLMGIAVAVAAGITAGVAPAYFQRPPAP